MSCFAGISLPRERKSSKHLKEQNLVECISCGNFEEFVRIVRKSRWEKAFLRRCTQLCVDKYRWKFIDTFACVDPCTGRTSVCDVGDRATFLEMMEGYEQTLCISKLSSNHILFLAAKEGHTKVVEYLLSVGCCPNTPYKTEDLPTRATALHAAVIFQHEHTVKSLISHQSTDHTLQYGEGKSALHLACDKHAHTILEYLLVHANDLIELGDGYSRTPLQQSSVTGCVRCVQLLLTHGAHANSRDDSYGKSTDTTPLMLAISRQNRTVASLILDDARCDLNATDFTSRMTALHRAADLGDVELVTLLLEHGAWPNPVDADGATPLSLAVNERHTEAAILLLRHIGDPDPSGRILLMARERGLDCLISPLIHLGALVCHPCRTTIPLVPQLLSLKRLCKLAVRRGLGVVSESTTSTLGLPCHLVDYLYQVS